MSRREKHIANLQLALTRALQRREDHLRRLVGTEVAIRDLRSRLKRRKEGAALAQTRDEMIKGIVALKTEPCPEIDRTPQQFWKNPEEPSAPPVEPEPPIPEFLRRGQAAQAAIDDLIEKQRIEQANARDKEIAERIRAEQAEKKKERAQQRKEKKDVVPPSKFTDEKAKQMPLTGRAALNFIRKKRA
jgi:hypothetical protein